jgi:hypothetical protein
MNMESRCSRCPKRAIWTFENLKMIVKIVSGSREKYKEDHEFHSANKDKIAAA